MADIKDVRRLTISVMLTAGLIALLLLFLWLHDRGSFTWVVPEKMLGWLSYDVWAVVLGFVFVALVGIIGLLVFSLPIAAGGHAVGRIRQVQCQECKAVFHLTDGGERPLIHNCPSCRSMGIYDGTAPPVGEPPKPEPAKRVVQIGLTCESCAHDFKFTDSGVRPLDIVCPACHTEGTIY